MQAMLLSVGAGKGVEYAIAQTIDQNNPSVIAFIATKQSYPILDNVIQVLRDIYNNESAALICEKAKEEGLCECISDSDAEDVTMCHQAALRLIDTLRSRDVAPKSVTVDFTSGTKPMSAGLVLAAVQAGCKSLSYVGGSHRDEVGRVKRGAGVVKAVQPTSILLELVRDQLIKDFNSWQFGACRNNVEWVKSRMDLSLAPDVEALGTLADFYEAWDRFDHARADGLSKQVKEAEKVWHLDTKYNRSVVHRLAEAKQKPTEELLRIPKDEQPSDQDAVLLVADIYANALRRLQEGRYDDAVARLYRVTELVAQIVLLSEFGQFTSCVDKEFLKEHDLLDTYAASTNRKGEIQLGLYRAYQLLKDLNNEFGGLYLDDAEFQKHIAVRNDSILAHGFTTVGKEACEKLSSDVRELCCKLVASEKRFNNLLAQCKFPSLSSRTDTT